MKRFNKLISSVIMVCFILNTAVSDYALALDPGKISTGGLRPADSSEAVRDDMYTAGEVLWAERKGPGAIDFDLYIRALIGARSGEKVDWRFVDSDESLMISKLGTDPIYKEKSLRMAVQTMVSRHFGSEISVITAYPDASHGDFVAWTDGKKLVLNAEFESGWNVLRDNDIWFEYSVGGEKVTESACWAIFNCVIDRGLSKRRPDLSDMLMDFDSQKFAATFLKAALLYRNRYDASGDAAGLSPGEAGHPKARGRTRRADGKFENEPGKSPGDLLRILALYHDPSETIDAPKALDIYRAHYAEFGFEAPAVNRSSALQTIRRDLYEVENSLLKSGLLRKTSRRGERGEVELAYTELGKIELISMGHAATASGPKVADQVLKSLNILAEQIRVGGRNAEMAARVVRRIAVSNSGSEIAVRAYIILLEAGIDTAYIIDKLNELAAVFKSDPVIAGRIDAAIREARTKTEPTGIGSGSSDAKPEPTDIGQDDQSAPAGNNALTGPVTQFVPYAYTVATQGAGDIQIGSPSELMKFFMRNKRPVPSTIVLPKRMMVDGINYGDVEFFCYYNFFVNKGRKVTIIGTAQQAEAIRQVLSETIMGPGVHDMIQAGMTPEQAMSMKVEFDYFNKKGDGSLYRIDDYVELVVFDADNTAAIGNVKVRSTGRGFAVEENGQLIAEVPHAEGGLSAPEIVTFPDKPFAPPAFGVTFIGSSTGFDPMGLTTSFITWWNGKGMLVDPLVYSVNHMRSLGIDPEDVQDVFLSHVHSDHDAGLMEMILNGRRINLITSRVIFDSFMRKASAITGRDLRTMVNFVEAKPGTPLHYRGVTFHFAYGLHSIPCLGFRMSYKGKSLSYSGDTRFEPEFFDRLQKEGVIGGARRAALQDFVFSSDVVIHEAGGLPLHTQLQTLGGLREELKRRIYVVHSPKVDPATGLRKPGKGESIDLLADDIFAVPENEDILAMRTVGFFDKLDLREILILTRKAKPVTYRKGEAIIRQGEPGDNFYVISSGEVEVTVKRDDDTVRRVILGKGSPFGEQALLEDGRSRNATVTALTDVRLLAFDRALFNELSAAEGVRASMEKVDANRQLLSNVSAFTKLPHRGMVEVCNIAETAAYSKGELLIKQGEPGDNFFIIRSGSVDVIDEATGRIIDTKTSGDVVGEIALLRDTPRTATVRAGSDKVEALVIKRADFDGIIAKYPYIRYYLEQLSEERLRNIVAQRRAAALSEAGQAVTEGEISAAIDWINRREGDIFTPDKRREITAKVLSMALVKGGRFLVVGPGMQDYLPILLARLGIDTTTIDTNPAVADFMSRLAEKFSLTGMIKSVSDYDAIKGGKFDYISMFAVLNNIAPSSDPFITDNLNSIRGLESSFDMREADRGRKIDYYAGLIRQACEAYILPALEQITEQLNENGTLFVNSPPFAASREIASRIDYMDMLDSALSTIGDGQGIRFARQDGVDVSGLSMVSAHLNEARDGAAYVKVVAAQRGKPEAAKLAAGDEASGTVTPGVFVNVVRNLMKVDRAAEERVIKGMDKAMDDGLAGRPSSLKMIPAYVGAATGEEEGDYFAIDVGGTNLRVLGVRLEKGKNPSPIGDAEKAVIPASIVNGGSAEDLFGFVVGTIKEYARKNSIDPKAGMKFGLTWSFPVEQTGVASGIHKEWTKGWNVSGVVGKDPVALLSAALEREGLGNVKILAMCNDTVGTLMFGDVGLILGTGTNAAFPVAVKDIGKFKGRTGLEFMAINSEWGNFDGAPTEAWDEILDDMSSNPGRQKLEKMISGMYLGEVARLIMNMLVSEGELFRGRNYRVITDDPKKPGEDGFTAGLMSAIEKVDPDKDPDLSGVATILAGIGITDTTPDDRRAVRNICGAVSQRAARISASALAAVIKKSGVLSRKDTCRVAIDGSVFKHYHRFRETMEGALVEIFGAKEAARIKLVTADDGSGIGAAIIAAVVDRSEGRAAPAAGPATIKPQPTDVADEVEDMAPDDPESGDEAVEAIGDILDLLRIHETRNLPDNYFDMTTDFGFKYRLMQAASRSMWIMGPWETKDTDPVRAVWRIDHSVLSEFREWLLEYAKVARSNAPAPAPADIKGRAAIKSLPEVISEYIDRMAPDKGPDAVPRKLLASETKAIWDSVNLLDAENIEIIIPQRVRPTGEATGRFLLTDSVKRTLDDIRKRHGRDSVKINEYGSQKDLLGILRNGDPAAKRIVITDGELAGEVQSLSGDQPDLFLNVRLYSMELPNGYGDMSANDKSVVQARALSIAILMRLYDKDRFSVRMILEGLLEGRLADGVDVSDFIDSITDPDTIKRIKYFLGRTVKLVETMGKQLRLLERFVWSAA